MNDRPIGIFDSGLGGLTSLRTLHRLLPEENIVCFADTGRCPYGEKSSAQLRTMAVQNLRFLSSFNVKAILVACGTLSANAADLLDAWHVPAIGVLRPTVAALRQLPGTGPLAVIATEASIRSGGFQRAVRAACPGREVLALACPEFVPLIESGHFHADDPLLRESVSRTLAPLQSVRPSALVLGCTHYGVIAAAISDFLGPELPLIHAADCGAEAICSLLQASGETGGRGEIRYYTSGDAESFSEKAALLLGGAPSAYPAVSVPPAVIPEFLQAGE
ncbi:MAG: glutamate racemase [Oscillospiraceae bacterium]|nr:glutamate racemase [Oscillospiraceae bacterium]